MKPSLRAVFLGVFFPIVAGMLMVCEISWAQSPEKPAEPTKTKKLSGPQKPTRSPDQVVTDDSISLLSVRRAPRVAEAPAGEAATDGNAGTAVESTMKAAEIATVEKQIQEKQKRIVLLMRLFVKDERPFLNDPDGTTGDSAARERRKYEQDELLWETAELARLRGKLEQLTSAGKENAAAKP
jgi:hypothetical protein